MIKNVIMDLGNTIIKNIEFDFKKGLSIVYQQLITKKMSEKAFIQQGYVLMKQMYQNRHLDNIEVPFKTYLQKLEDVLGVNYNQSYEVLELTIYKNCVKDELIQDAFAFLMFAKAYGLSIYVYSNSTFSKKVLMTTLDQFNISSYICGLYSSSDVGMRKPSSAFFFQTPPSKKLNNEECLFVGNDDYDDRLFAKAIQIKFCWYNVDQKKRDYSDVSLDFASYNDLKEYITTYDK